jgi:hypothetical protein
VSGAPPVKGQLPLLITNAGQGRGQDGAPSRAAHGVITDFDYNAGAARGDLRNAPARPSWSSWAHGQGPGRIGHHDRSEIERLNAMIAGAEAQDADCRGALGATRRGKPGGADERSIDAVAPFGSSLVVKKDGNEDGRFDAIARKTGAPLTFIDDAVDFSEVVKLMYGK